MKDKRTTITSSSLFDVATAKNELKLQWCLFLELLALQTSTETIATVQVKLLVKEPKKTRNEC
jgi:hypothetical protein